jgi:hypothetical protein
MTSTVLQSAERYATLCGDGEEFRRIYDELRERQGVTSSAVDSIIMLYGEAAVPVALSILPLKRI